MTTLYVTLFNTYVLIVVCQSCDLHVTVMCHSPAAVSAHPYLHDGVCGGEAGGRGTGAGVSVPPLSGARVHPLQLGPLQHPACGQPQEEVSLML